MRRIWNPNTVAESMAVECPIVLRSKTVEKDEADRREPGPDETNLINYYVAVWIEVGNASVGEIAKLPAHEPIPIETAFRAAMKAAMGDV